MKQKPSQNSRILAIAPSHRGFGFAVLDGTHTLMDWGVIAVEPFQDSKGVKRFLEIEAQYQPTDIVMPDFSEGPKRSMRVRLFARQIENHAVNLVGSCKLLTREEVAKAVLESPNGTKHQIAEKIAVRFPKELGHRLPQKRRAWEAEKYSMDIFDAVSLGFSLRVNAPRID